jgi:hypothetical protein
MSLRSVDLSEVAPTVEEADWRPADTAGPLGLFGRVVAARPQDALVRRRRIVLGCAAGKPNKEVAAEVGKWHQRFVVDQLAGLADEPRTGGAAGDQR